APSERMWLRTTVALRSPAYLQVRDELLGLPRSVLFLRFCRLRIVHLQAYRSLDMPITKLDLRMRPNRFHSTDLRLVFVYRETGRFKSPTFEALEKPAENITSRTRFGTARIFTSRILPRRSCNLYQTVS